jgi:hypothetical protein
VWRVWELKAQFDDRFVGSTAVCDRLNALGNHGNQVAYPHEGKEEIVKEKRRSDTSRKKGKRCSSEGGIAWSFIGTKWQSPRRVETPRQRPRRRRPQRLTVSGLLYATSHSLPCCESPALLASSQRPSLLLAPCSSLCATGLTQLRGLFSLSL